MRAQPGYDRCFPDPLGIVPSYRIGSFAGKPRQAMRAQMGCIRYFPDPLGIVPACRIGSFAGKPQQARRTQPGYDRCFPDPPDTVPLYNKSCVHIPFFSAQGGRFFITFFRQTKYDFCECHRTAQPEQHTARQLPQGLKAKKLGAPNTPQVFVIISPVFAACQSVICHFIRFLPFQQRCFGYFMQYCILQIAKYMIR